MVFVWKNAAMWQRYDVGKFDTDAILFREVLSKKMDILMIKRCFQCGLD